MPRTRKAWKEYERAVAADLGTHRIPVSGRTGKDQDPGDIFYPGWFIEVKDQARPLPIRWFLETAWKAKGSGQKPLLIFRAPGYAGGPLAILPWQVLAEVIKGENTRRNPLSPAGEPTQTRPAENRRGGKGESQAPGSP